MDVEGHFGTTQHNVVLNETEPQERGVISDELREILDPGVAFITLPFNILGVLTNVINIRVFIEQGVRNDSTNICLLCLSIFDLFGCATLIPYPLCFSLKYSGRLAQHYTCISFAALLTHVHTPLQQIGAWTTVYISLIRSLCVVFPLKVKLMFTPKITIIAITFIFMFFGVFQIIYSGSFISLVWVYHPKLNASIAQLKDSPAGRTVLYYKQLLTNQILSVIAVIVVSMTTAIMGKKLIEVKAWRQKNSSGSGSDAKEDSTGKSLPSKEIELIKLINAVTIIFLVCVLMGFIPSIAVMTLPGVGFTGINKNLFFIVFLIRFVFDAINSSINFFFYIRVTSRYKTAFAKSFKICSRQESID